MKSPKKKRVVSEGGEFIFGSNFGGHAYVVVTEESKSINIIRGDDSFMFSLPTKKSAGKRKSKGV